MPDAQVYVQDYARPEKIRHSSSRRHAPKIGDPVPLGLSAFAMSMMVSALYNLKAFGVVQPNVIVGVCLFTGGVSQFASGMWSYKVGNTFAGTGFSAYGCFWLSYGVIYIPSFGIRDAFKDDYVQFQNALGIYLLAWLVFTTIFTLGCIRTSAGVLSAFIFLTITFAGEMLSNFYPATDIFIKFAGVTGMLTSVSVFYVLAASFLTPDLSPISLPVWDLSHKD